MRLSLEQLESRLLLAHPFLLQNEQEPNDSLESANEIRWQSDHNAADRMGERQVFGSVQGDLANFDRGVADVDFFAVSTLANSVSNFSFRASSPNLRIVPRLLNESGLLVTEFQPRRTATGGLIDDELVAELFTTTPARVFIQVGPGTDVQGDRTSGYSLTVRATQQLIFEQEPNNSIEQANPIELAPVPDDTRAAATPLATASQLRGFVSGTVFDSSAAVDCSLDFPNCGRDFDLFTFSADAARKLIVRFESSAVQDYGIFPGVRPVLLDAHGSVLATATAQDEDGDGAVDSAILEQVTAAGGKFFVSISGNGLLPQSLYRLTVDVLAERSVEPEPNDTFDTAQEIPLSWSRAACPSYPMECWPGHGFIRGSLENGEVSPDTDFYQITVRPDSTVGVRASGAGSQGGHLTVYDQEHNVIAEADPNADGILAARFESAEASRFFIQLTDAGNVVCITTPCLTYELHVTARHEVVDPSVEHEPNNSFDMANRIVLHGRFEWPCEFVCPLATDPAEQSTGPVEAGDAQSSGVSLRPIVWPGDGTLTGFVEGELEAVRRFTGPSGCSDLGDGQFVCTDDLHPFFVPGVDYFSLQSPANYVVRVELSGGLLRSHGEIALFDQSRAELASDRNPQEGLKLEWDTVEGGTFYVRVRSTAAVLDDSEFVECPAGGECSEPQRVNPTDYALRVTATPVHVNPHVEREPNDTLDTANRIALSGDFGWPCDFVCPLANAAGVVDDPNEPGTTTDDSAAGDGVEVHPIRWPGDDSLHGFISGELEFFTCPPEMACIAVVQHGVDNFVFDVPAGQFVSVRLTGPLARNNGVLTLLNSDGGVLTADVDNSDGLAVEWRAREGGTFYARVTAGFPTVELQIASAVSCNDTPALAGSLCALPWTYRVDVTAEPLPNPIEGKDEHEPNDTIDQANHLELRRDGSDKWGVVFRERVAHGIAGGPAHDVDFFSFEARPGEDVTVGLGCVPGFDLEPIVILPDDPDEPPIDLPEPITTPVLVVVVFDSEGSEIGRTGIDGSENVLFHSDSGGVYYAMMTLEGGAPDAEPTPYELHIHTRSIQIEGRDEQEPNDTIEQANELPLHVFPTFAPGIELRGGDAAGIAGGPTGDADAFEFAIEAGEHVTVDVQGLVFDGVLPRPMEIWLNEHGLNEFGDPVGTRHGGPRGRDLQPADPIHSILEKHPDLEFGNFVVTVFDSAGNEVGSSASSDSGAVTFDSATGGAYFAVVSAAESSASDRPGHYRLGVIARSDFDPEKVDPNDPNAGTGEGGEGTNEDPFVVVLGPRGSFEYTDENGESVVIQFRGSSGKATITFTDSEADGSDIASIDIDGVRKNGNLSIHTVGSAEVGEIAIHGMTSAAAGARRRGGGRSASFGTIDVDGNVGQVSSDMNIRALVVDGVLGDLDAHNRQIGEVRAETFDAALADVGSIRLLAVESSTEDELFASLLPWEDPA